MARKLCTVCNTRTEYTGSSRTQAIDDAPRGSHMCNLCYTEGGWENSHSDYDHDENSDANCWFCHPELNLATVTERKAGHTNTATKTPHRSHAGCTHPRTPKGRAACRKAGGPKA